MTGLLQKTLYLASLRTISNRAAYLNEFKNAERLSADEASALRTDLLGRLLHHAWQNVPYYRHVLQESGVSDASGNIDMERFTSIPLLDKDTIRNNFEEMKSSDLSRRKWHINTSGGSTGEPVPMVQDTDYDDWVGAGKIFFDLWSGYAPGEPKVLLWGSERDLFVGRETAKIRLRRWVKNETCLNTFRMSPQQMKEHVDTINRTRPVQILAYAESAYELARFIESEGLSVHSPKSVMTSAGTLFQHVRETIERVFRAPVFNRYGSREAGDMACECEAHAGLHVPPLTHHIEILRPDGSPAPPGEAGEIVATPLRNLSMPLIRYRIGDMGVWAEGTCPCGRHWPLLKEITGRVSDTFVTADGTQVHGEYFTHLFYFRDWVRKFQVIQEDHNLIRCLVIPAESAESIQSGRAGELEEIISKIKLVMGEGCRVEFDFVTDIPPSASGKFRFTISRVRHET